MNKSELFHSPEQETRGKRIEYQIASIKIPFFIDLPNDSGRFEIVMITKQCAIVDAKSFEL